RTAVTTARETVRRRIRSRSAAAVPAGGPDAAAPEGSGPASYPAPPDRADPGTGTATASRVLAGARGFVPALEGIRGLAAVGVLTTHVAFVTRASTGSPVKRLFGRLDLAVAVFFAKSGFLLRRSHAAHARRGDRGTARSTPAYLRSRLVRIMPAYGALVVAAMLLLPQN